MNTLSPEESSSLHGAGWIVVSVTAGHEFDLSRDIANSGFSTYVPALIFRRPRPGWRNAIIEIIRPMFQGYCLTRSDADFVARDFRTYKRIVKRLPGAATDAQIETVREIEAQANSLPAAIVARPIEPGDFATIIRGVLKGESAEVLRVKGRNAVINLTKHGRRSIVTMARDDLEAVL